MTTDQPCHWTGERRALGPRHDGACDGCETCEKRHCAQCGATHLQPAGAANNISDLPLPGPGDLVCARCVGRTRTNLDEIRDLYGRLDEEALHHPNDPIPGGTPLVLAGPWSPGEPGHVADETGTPTPPLLVLATWEDAGRDILGLPEGPRPATVDTAVTWLRTWLTELAKHDAWLQMAEEIRAVRTQLENVLRAGSPPDRGVKCLMLDCTGELKAHYREPKPCPHDTEAKRDARWIVAEAKRRRAENIRPLVPSGAIRSALREARRPCEDCDQGGRRDERRCTRCGRVYDQDEYDRAVAHEAAQHKLQTAAEIARTLGVRPGRVRLWASRGKLKAAEHRKGRPVYDIREARRLAMRSDVA